MKYPPLNKEYSPFFNVKRVFREALIILYACKNETQVFQLKEDGSPSSVVYSLYFCYTTPEYISLTLSIVTSTPSAGISRKEKLGIKYPQFSLDLKNELRRV